MMKCDGCGEPITAEQLGRGDAYLHLSPATIIQAVAMTREAQRKVLDHTNGEPGVVTLEGDDIPVGALAHWALHHAECDESTTDDVRISNNTHLDYVLMQPWVRFTDLGLVMLGGDAS